MTMHEVAAALRVSVRTVARLMRDGTLDWIQVSPRIRRVRTASVEALLRRAA